MNRIVPRCALASITVSTCLFAAYGGAAHAQPLSFRISQSTQPFTPLHSYAEGEISGDLIFFSGISGKGLHNQGEGSGVIGFPFDTFNRQIILLDTSNGALFFGSIGHLSAATQELLTVTNPSAVQYGNSLYLYGGYGPNFAQNNFLTHSSVTQIDLDAVRTAVRAGAPVPESAFVTTFDPNSQITGARLIKMEDKFCIVCGAYFTGDYGRSVTTNFDTVYPNKVWMYDSNSSFSTPVQTFFTSATTSDRLRRRDMNALPATLPPAGGGVERYPGFAGLGGVFRLGAFVWETPISYAYGDTAITHHTGFLQRMNQYEGAGVSFYSPSADQNRFVLFSGISSSVWNGSTFTNVFPQIPWGTEITEITMTAGTFVSETVRGNMPLPMVNAPVILNPLIPTNSIEQVRIDLLPANEVLLGRIYGGLRAAATGNTPPTFASNAILEVYVVAGVRGDISRDGTVNATDLALLLGAWGTPLTTCDMNLDGVVNSTDLAMLLGLWGNSTPG